MAFEIVGSHLCPNTLYALIKCKEAGLVFSFKDLSASLADLKVFLALHENADAYREYRKASSGAGYAENGRIGLPCFVFGDGTVTLDFDEAFAKAKALQKNL